MSRTLNLVDILLGHARQLFQLGRFTEALTPLSRLAGFRNVSDDVCEEIQSLLGEIYLQQKEYKKARRHLTAAIAMKPLKAESFHLMAVAIDEDDFADRRRAEMYYARATELEPDEPAYWIDYGEYLFTIGKDRPALHALRKAFKIGIHDAETVGRIAEVLREEGQAEIATDLLRTALFHHHGAQAFRQLWQRHQFALIYLEQQHRRRQAEGRDDGPLVLRFEGAPTQGKYVELGEQTIRIDQAEELHGPTQRKPMPHRRRPKG